MIGVNPRLDQLPDRELLEGQVEQHRVVLEEVEPVPGDLAAGLEVDQVERLAELDVVLGREVEGAGRADLAELAAVVLGRARPGRRDGSGWGPRRAAASSSSSSRRSCSSWSPTSALSRLPSAISSARLAGSFSLPVAWATSFCRRRTSSTAWSSPFRSPSSATTRSRSSSTSAGTFGCGSSA